MIDYQKQKFEEILKDFDVVFDMVGGDVTTRSFQVMRKGGILVSMVGQPPHVLAEKFGVSVIGQNTQTNHAHLTRLAELVDSGKIKVHIDKVFPFNEVRDAFIHLETGHPRGKVVLRVK